MGRAKHVDFGAYLDCVQGVTPTRLDSTSDTDGASWDGRDNESIVIHAQLNADASSDQVKFDLQESSDDNDSDAWEDTGDSITLTADGSGHFEGELDVNTSGYERYLRLTCPSGDQSINGTAIRFAATVVLGGFDETPA
jgi:hypothetical protein